MRLYLILVFSLFGFQLFAQNASELEELTTAYQAAFEQRDYKKAEQLANKRLKITKTQSDSNYVNAVYDWAEAQIKMQNFEAAEKILQESIDGIKKNKISCPTELSFQVRNKLGATYFLQQKMDQAAPFYDRLLKDAVESLGKDHPIYFKIAGNLVSVYKRNGQLEKAEELSKEVIASLKAKGEDKSFTYAKILFKISSIYLRQNRLEEVRSIYEEIYPIYKAEAEQIDYAGFLLNYGIFNARTGRIKQADKLFGQAISLQEKLLGEAHPKTIKTRMNHAVMHMQSGNFAKAKTLLLEIDKTISTNPKTPLSALSLLHEYLAIVHAEAGDYNQAKAYFIQSLKDYEQLSGGEDHRYASKLINFLNFQKREDPNIDPYPLIKKVLYANSPDLDSSIQLNMQLLDQIVEIETYKESPLLTALDFWSDALSNEYNSSQDISKLQQSFQVRLASQNRIYQNRKDFNNSKDQLAILAKTKEISEILLQQAYTLYEKTKDEKYLQQAFFITEQNKSILLADALKAQSSHRLAALPDSLYQKEQALRLTQKELKKELILAKEKQEISKKLNDTNFELNELNKTIEQKYPQYFKHKYASKDQDLSEIQKALGQDMAIIEYNLGSRHLYVFYLDAQQIQYYQFQISSDSLTRKIAALRKALSDYDFITTKTKEAYQLYTSTAYWFFENCLEKVLAGKTKIKELNIITDGKLGHLPFEAFLTDPVTEKLAYNDLPYLLKRYNISYNYNSHLWLENLQNNAQPTKGLLGIAANYENKIEAQSRSANLRGLRDALQALPAARKEVEKLEASLKGDFWYDDQANEVNFKAQAADYQIIHLAMHGLLNKKSPLLSALAFTENGDSLEDNFLQAYEISSMNLQAELVVLSACETGYGKFEHGEGVMSLARSFMYAGVPSLLVSLWQVNDASTAMIMNNYYENLRQSMSKGAALQKAKLDYIQLAAESDPKAAHPAFWAAFIQIGDERAIQLHQGGTSWWLYALGAILILGLVVYGISRNRKKKEA